MELAAKVLVFAGIRYHKWRILRPSCSVKVIFPLLLRLAGTAFPCWLLRWCVFSREIRVAAWQPGPDFWLELGLPCRPLSPTLSIQNPPSTVDSSAVCCWSAGHGHGTLAPISPGPLPYNEETPNFLRPTPSSQPASHAIDDSEQCRRTVPRRPWPLFCSFFFQGPASVKRRGRDCQISPAPTLSPSALRLAE